MKFLNKKVIDLCSAYNIAEVHQFPRNSVTEFKNICNEMVAPFFCATMYMVNKDFIIIIILFSEYLQ